MGTSERRVRVTIRRPERGASSDGVSRRVQKEDGFYKGDVATDRGIQVRVICRNETQIERSN